MKNATLWIALALSVGLNLGLLASAVIRSADLSRGDQARTDPLGEREGLGEAKSGESVPSATDSAGEQAEEKAAVPRASDPPAVQPVTEPPAAAATTRLDELTTPVAAEPPPSAVEEPRVADPLPDPRPHELPRPGVRPGDRSGGGIPPITTLADRLGLEGEPRERFIAAQQRLYDHTQRRVREIETLHAELRRELVARRPDRNRVGELTDRIGRAYEELDVGFARGVLETRDLLDPEREARYLRFIESLRLRAVERARRAGDRPGPTRRR